MDFLIVLAFACLLFGALGILEAMSDFLCEHIDFIDGLFSSVERRVFGDEYDEEDDLYE